MAVTLTEQWRVWPSGSGEIEWLVDGEGMHANVPFDLVRQLNNIGSYVCNWGQFVFNSDPSTDITVEPPGEPGEFFLMQFPVVIPRGAVRMLWTAGIVNGAAMTIDFAKVYLSSTPYTLPGSFGPTYISPVYSSHAVTQTVSTAVYSLFSDTTGLTNFDGIGGATLSNTGWANIAYLIFTVDVSVYTSGFVTMKDFTCWFAYE